MVNCCGIQQLLTDSMAVRREIEISNNPFECGSIAEVIGSNCGITGTRVVPLTAKIMPNPTRGHIQVQGASEVSSASIVSLTGSNLHLKWIGLLR